MNIYPITALKDNYIWVLSNDDNTRALIVDPGDASPVINMLEQRQLALAGILVTHHHWDHTNGIAALLEYAGDVPVVGSHHSQNQYVNARVKNGDVVTIEHVKCKAIEIPGHTLDHTAYVDANESFVFTGDTLFSAGCGRIFEGTPAMMFESLSKLRMLNDDVKIYCGHEYTRANLKFAQTVEPDNIDIIRKLTDLPACTLPSTLGEEKRVNPFLRCREPDVVRAAEAYANRKLSSDVEVFAVLREWKNNFC